MELIDFLIDRTHQSTVGSPEVARAIVIGQIRPYSLLVKNCKKAFASLEGGSGYLAITVDLGGPERLRRLAALMTLRLRLARLKRAMEDSGAVSVGSFGVAHCPLCIFPLHGPGALYAKNNLLVTGHGLREAFLRLLTWSAGCHVFAEAVLVVGRKP